MIPISRFREWCIELMSEVNACKVLIEHLVLGVDEGHIIKKIKDKKGVCLCVNYPDATGNGADDNETDVQPVYFFVVEKVNPGSQTDDAEMLHYGKLQDITIFLRNTVRNFASGNCLGVEIDLNDKIEWEYQIFGGFNGLSLGIKITDVKYG